MNDGQTTDETTNETVTVEFPNEMDVNNLDRTKETIIQSGENTIHLIHEITLGEVVIASLLAVIALMFLLNSLIRR
ncbi:hypothetical protein U3A55_02410 [Salarchaeum sp. III]|uniref:hypothetical protein n=1 Tax=Salarchaeum sp. III TaxID=3107927 RepID=UPI002EDB7A05